MPYATKELQTANLDDISRVRSRTITTSETLVLGDANSIIEVNSAVGVIVTVPPDSSVPYAVGSVIGVYRHGTGTVQIAPGAGVTIRSEGGATGSRAVNSQYSEVSIRKRAANDWVLAGDVA